MVLLTGLFILGFLASRTYSAAPPVPGRVVTLAGRVLFTATDIQDGQKAFLRWGLMEYGSIYGHGAYRGPDFTADALRRSALAAKAYYVQRHDPDADRHVADDFKTNRYDPAADTLRLSEAQASAFDELEAHYGQYFGAPASQTGLHLQQLLEPHDVHALASFFAWSAWTASTQRPGKEYSYTNSWPAEPRVRNQPTATALVFSMLSLAALRGGMGALLGWHGRDQNRLVFRRPSEVRLTPAQRSCAWFFFVMGRSSSCRSSWVEPHSTTAPTSPISLASTWGAGFRTTWRGPGTSSCPSFGSPRPFLRRAFFSFR